MCSCEHHWDTNAPCTCRCPDHAPVREEMARRAEQRQAIEAGPWPRGVAGTFTRPCLDCGTTIHVVDTVEQPHDCQPPLTPTEETRALAANAYWTGYDAGVARRPHSISRE